MTNQSTKEVFLVTSFCDNEEKIQLLKETLQHLKPLNIPMCVHDPVGVEEDLIKAGADYLIVDPSNPIPPLTQRSIYAFCSLPCNDDILLNNHASDIGGAAAHQQQSSLSYLSSLGYDVAHIVNYDTFIDLDFFIKTVSPKALKYDAVLYGANDTIEKWGLSTIFYSMNLHRCDKIIRSISFADYMATTTCDDSFETYVSRKMLGANGLTIDKIPFQDVKDLIYDKYSCHFDVGPKEKYQLGHIKVFIESSTPKTRFWFGRKKTLEVPREGPASVIFYDIQEAFEAKLIVNGQTFETKVEKPPVPDYFLLESTIKGNNIESARVIIDGDVVVDKIYDNFLLNSIEFKKNE